METTKLYSRDKLHNMMDQNEEEVNELMMIFIQMAPPMLKDLEQHVRAEEWLECSEIAHKLKSSMRLWAFDTLDEDVVFIETHSKNLEYLEEVKEKINNLIHKLLISLDQMKAEIKL